MNKTLSIGLAGFSFVIEEHAYIKLSDYLAALRNSLEADEADEVMHDIEIRMVEIFKDTLGKREVINDADVEKVIAQIGKPEQIEEQEEAYFSEKSAKTSQKTTFTNGQKQLFRDPERQKIAGVCAGLAHYVGMDMTAMRAIWVGLFLLLIPIPGSPMMMIFLYIILWIVLPKAETAADFLKMKGKPMNFDNLKQESTKIVQFANESTEKVGQAIKGYSPYINTAGDRIANIFRYFIGGFFGLIGVVLLLSSFAVFGASFNEDLISVPGKFQFYLEDSFLKFFGLATAFLTVFIPAIILLYLAMKLISPKTKLNYTGYVLGALVFLWIIGIMLFGIKATKYKNQYSGNKEETENVAINTTSDSLYVEVKQISIPQNFTAYNDDIFSDKKMVFEEDYPYIEVARRPDVKTPYLIVKKQGEGYNVPVQLTVPVEVQDNKILLPNFVSYPYAHRFRDYHVNYELVVPQNTKVFKVKNNVNLRGDTDGNGSDDDNEDESSKVVIEKNKINMNGNTIEYNSNDKDSIIINGKKVQKDQAEKIINSMKMDFKKMENVDISIKNGKKEISIKTK